MLRAAAMIACMPLAQIGLSLATPDASLLLFWSLALAALVAALRPQTSPRARTLAWALAGLSLGAALSTKYTAVLLLASAGIALLAQPPLRRMLATRGPYIALAIALIVFAPNLVWNATHGWASFAYPARARTRGAPRLAAPSRDAARLADRSRWSLRSSSRPSRFPCTAPFGAATIPFAPRSP